MPLQTAAPAASRQSQLPIATAVLLHPPTVLTVSSCSSKKPLVHCVDIRSAAAVRHADSSAAAVRHAASTAAAVRVEAYKAAAVRHAASTADH